MQQEETGKAAMNLKVSWHWKYRDFKISFPSNPDQRPNMSIFSLDQKKSIYCVLEPSRCFDSFGVLQCEY